MTSPESVQFHIRFVTERFNSLTTSLDNLVKILVGESLTKKQQNVSILLEKANDLKSSISENDYPAWLGPLIGELRGFLDGHRNQQNLISYIINNMNSIKAHRWIFDSPNDKAFDFDSIFNHYKSESRLPELFDEIVRILDEIRNSGEVDSVTMMSALAKVIATLKKSKDGSYFSINSAWSFLVSFLKNYMWGELAKLPVLGTAMEALEKTIKETDEEMFKLHKKVQGKMEEMVEKEVKALNKKSDFKFIDYNRDGIQLPSLPNNGKISEKV